MKIPQEQNTADNLVLSHFTGEEINWRLISDLSEFIKIQPGEGGGWVGECIPCTITVIFIQIFLITSFTCQLIPMRSLINNTERLMTLFCSEHGYLNTCLRTGFSFSINGGKKIIPAMNSHFVGWYL